MLKTGLVRAAVFANNDMLRTLLKYCKVPLSDDVVDEGGPLVVTHDQIQLSAKSDSKLNSSDKK